MLFIFAFSHLLIHPLVPYVSLVAPPTWSPSAYPPRSLGDAISAPHLRWSHLESVRGKGMESQLKIWKMEKRRRRRTTRWFYFEEIQRIKSKFRAKLFNFQLSVISYLSLWFYRNLVLLVSFGKAWNLWWLEKPPRPFCRDPRDNGPWPMASIIPQNDGTTALRPRNGQLGHHAASQGVGTHPMTQATLRKYLPVCVKFPGSLQ